MVSILLIWSFFILNLFLPCRDYEKYTKKRHGRWKSAKNKKTRNVCQRLIRSSYPLPDQRTPSQKWTCYVFSQSSRCLKWGVFLVYCWIDTKNGMLFDLDKKNSKCSRIFCHSYGSTNDITNSYTRLTKCHWRLFFFFRHEPYLKNIPSKKFYHKIQNFIEAVNVDEPNAIKVKMNSQLITICRAHLKKLCVFFFRHNFWDFFVFNESGKQNRTILTNPSFDMGNLAIRFVRAFFHQKTEFKFFLKIKFEAKVSLTSDRL